MKPTCKLCGKGHWLDEGHQINTSVPSYVKEMTSGALGLEGEATFKELVVSPDETTTTVTKVADNVTPVTKRARDEIIYSEPPLEGHTHRGRPKKHKTNAERQRAYRERK